MSGKQWQVKLKHVPSGNLIVNKVCSDEEKEQYVTWFESELNRLATDRHMHRCSDGYVVTYDTIKVDGRDLGIVVSQALLEECVIEVLMVYGG